MVDLIVLSMTTIRKRLGSTRVQDTFGVDESVILVSRSSIQHVRLSIAMDTVRLVDPFRSRAVERSVQLEEGIFTEDSVIEFGSSFDDIE